MGGGDLRARGDGILMTLVIFPQEVESLVFLNLFLICVTITPLSVCVSQIFRLIIAIISVLTKNVLNSITDDDALF